MSQARIYLSPPHMGGNEIKYVQEAFDTNWIAPVGPHLTAFEKAFCEFTGAEHAVAVASGTAALHLALILAGVKPGGKVLCSDFTFAATVNSILYAGAEPVFIDSNFETWNMDPQLLVDEVERMVAAGEMPQAIMPVHILGQSVDLDPILAVAKKYEIPIVEDAAESLGGDYKGKHTGTFGESAGFSFNGNKIITTSGGGMFITNDEEKAQRARFLSTQAKEPTEDNHYLHHTVGYNYRMSNVVAGIGRGQLEVLPERIEYRRGLMDRYRQAFAETPGIEFMPQVPYGKANGWASAILVDPEVSKVDRRQIQVALEKENIETRPLWRPMHTQPVYADFHHVGGDVSKRLFEVGLWLPNGSSLSHQDQDRIIQGIQALATGA